MRQLPSAVRVSNLQSQLLAEESVIRNRSRAFLAVLVGLTALLLAGCPPRESIDKINQDPARFAGKDISVAGRVTDSFGALGNGVFQIDDGTGTMWVFSK